MGDFPRRGRPKGIPKTGGRAPGVRNKITVELMGIARPYGPECIDHLVNIMRTSDSDHTRVCAIRELLDRGYGKATQFIESASDHPIVVEIVNF